MELKWEKTERGFAIARFKDTYGKECTIQESSSIEPRLWVGCGEDRMHLSPVQCLVLAETLREWAKDNV